MKILTLMKPSPLQWNQLKTCPLGDFDMLDTNLTSKPGKSATQSRKWRKTTSNFFLSVHRVKSNFSLFFQNPFIGLNGFATPCTSGQNKENRQGKDFWSFSEYWKGNPVNALTKKHRGGFSSFSALGGGFAWFWRQIRVQHVKIS